MHSHRIFHRDIRAQQNNVRHAAILHWSRPTSDTHCRRHLVGVRFITPYWQRASATADGSVAGDTVTGHIQHQRARGGTITLLPSPIHPAEDRRNGQSDQDQR